MVECMSRLVHGFVSAWVGGFWDVWDGFRIDVLLEGWWDVWVDAAESMCMGGWSIPWREGKSVEGGVDSERSPWREGDVHGGRGGHVCQGKSIGASTT